MVCSNHSPEAGAKNRLQSRPWSGASLLGEGVGKERPNRRGSLSFDVDHYHLVDQ